jgi:hypothetical protein
VRRLWTTTSESHRRSRDGHRNSSGSAGCVARCRREAPSAGCRQASSRACPSLTAEIEHDCRRKTTAAKASDTINEHKAMFLNNIGRIGDLNLRSKVLQRWSTVPPSISSKLAGMHEAIAHSVQARNFFVHGSEVKTSKEAAYELAPFFTDTLEFVFGISELCTCGWNADRWAAESYSVSRFKWYIRPLPNFDRARLRPGLVVPHSTSHPFWARTNKFFVRSVPYSRTARPRRGPSLAASFPIRRLRTLSFASAS